MDNWNFFLILTLSQKYITIAKNTVAKATVFKFWNSKIKSLIDKPPPTIITGTVAIIMFLRSFLFLKRFFK